MMSGWDEHEATGRVAAGLAAGGTIGAVVAVLLAAIRGEPYLEADGVNPFVVVFAIALLVALVALPFGLEVALRGRQPDRDRRWELALVTWGGASALVAAVAFAVGFDTATLAGAVALIAAIEAALVVATVVVWLLAGG